MNVNWKNWSAWLERVNTSASVLGDRAARNIRRFPGRWLIGILLAGVGLWCWRLNLAPLLDRDEIFYLEQAGSWAGQGAAAAFRRDVYTAPLLLFLIKALMGTGLEAVTAGRIAVIGFGMGTGGAFFLIGKLLWRDNLWAIVLALMVVLHPRMIRMVPLIERDALYIGWCAAAVAAMLWAQLRQDGKGILLCGFFMVSGCFTRHEGCELLVFFFVWTGWLAWTRTPGRWRHLWFCWLRLGGGVLTGIVFYAVIMQLPLSYYQSNYWLPFRNIFARILN